MSVSITLYCEGDNCQRYFGRASEVRAGSVEDARAMHAKSGWVLVDGKDLCPGCAKKVCGGNES